MSAGEMSVCGRERILPLRGVRIDLLGLVAIVNEHATSALHHHELAGGPHLRPNAGVPHFSRLL